MRSTAPTSTSSIQGGWRSRESDTTTHVDASNREQERAWDGDEGAYWAAHHRRFEDTLARYQPTFLAAAAIQSDSRVLDIGCGTGVSTRAASQAAPTGYALGVDLSSQMIEVARLLAEQAGLGNAFFERADAQIHPFGTETFDVVVSRTGAMFFGRPEVAFANLRRALTPRGRLVLLTWQPPNRQEWVSAFSRALTGRTPLFAASDQPGPFSLSNPERVRTLLDGAGYADIEFSSLEEPTRYGRTAEEAYDLLIGLMDWMLEGQTDQRRATSVEAFRAVLAAHATASGVEFESAAWLITARRQ